MSGAKVSAFDREILRSAFHKSVHEDGIPEARWRDALRNWSAISPAQRLLIPTCLSGLCGSSS